MYIYIYTYTYIYIYIYTSPELGHPPSAHPLVLFRRERRVAPGPQHGPGLEGGEGAKLLNAVSKLRGKNKRSVCSACAVGVRG